MSVHAISVLLVEDSPGDARLLQEMFAEVTSTQFTLTHVERLSEARQRLDENPFDVVLLDLSLPDAHGFDTLVGVQARAPEIPIVVLTGLDDEALAVRAVREGAQDYLVKGQIGSGLLVRAVRYAIERKQAQEALRDYAEHLEERVQERTAQLAAQYGRLEAILDSVSDGIIVTNGKGKIVQANPVARRWLDQTLSPEEANRLREAVRDLADRMEEKPRDILALTGLDLELIAAPISEPSVEKATAVVAVHDISHLKALNRMRSRLITNLSHELRTPVTSIKLYATLMHQQPGQWKNYLEPLMEEAERQAQLVEGILQISQIDLGRLAVEPRSLALNDLIETVLVNHQTLAEDEKIALECQPAASSPVALADPKRMTQALKNVVENAIQYTLKGGAVTVSTGRREADGRMWATVTVTDTGMGIPEEELPHIFERFFRGEKPRKMQISGMGLGLTVAQRIVELHGGRITVESQADEGSTFTIWLPHAEQQDRSTSPILDKATE